MQYNPEAPVAPRYDTNAPDLYIPGNFIILTEILLSESCENYV